MLFDNSYIGPEVGYYYLIGHDRFSYTNYPAESSHIIPLTIMLGYTVKTSNSFWLDMSLSSGIAYNIVSYNDLVEDKSFHIKNSFETEYDVVYSGISLWSIIEEENLIIQTASSLEFRFYARDGYGSPKFLNLSIVEANSDLIILARVIAKPEYANANNEIKT